MFSNHQQPLPYATLLHFVILLLQSSAYSYMPICNHQDQSSLLAFSSKISTSFPPLNWSSTISCCHWEGIDCDISGRVTCLRLPSRGLEGEITSTLGNLTKLVDLNLSNNLFFGVLHNALFGSMDSLKKINFSSNHLSGNFLSSTSSKSRFPLKIHSIDISNNQFNGLIESPWFLGLKNLSYFNCSNNSFVGPIPSSICSSSPLLETLDLSHNLFSGQIPTRAGECSHLKVFRAGFNFLFGSIPKSIQNLKELVEISIPSNDLEHSLGKEIVGLTNLRVMDFSTNRIFGLIPQEIAKLVFLEKLHLDSNNISGPIPLSLMKCIYLTHIILRDNHLDGDISQLDLSRLVQLQKFDLRNNSFNGTLPESMYSCKSLVAIRVSRNNLTGQLSPKLVELRYLSFLSLSYNSFTNITTALQVLANCKNLTLIFFGGNFHGESLPSDKNFLSSTSFPRLKYFFLDDCRLTGSFPEWVSNLKTLQIISLNRNRITGKIPHFIGTLPNLFSLSLEGNLLHDEIPQELFNLPRMVLGNELNKFHFELPIFLRGVTGIYNQYTTIRSTLVLANNNLNGHIPWQIGGLQSLQQLDLGGNFLSGPIPDSLSKLKNLEVLQLSENNLTGKIPELLQALNFLSDLNVSYNDLEGEIPTGGQLATFDHSSFEGNPRLCGLVLQRPCFSKVRPNAVDQSLNDTNDTSDKVKVFFNGLFVGFAVGFSSILVIVASYVCFNHLHVMIASTM